MNDNLTPETDGKAISITIQVKRLYRLFGVICCIIAAFLICLVLVIFSEKYNPSDYKKEIKRLESEIKLLRQANTVDSLANVQDRNDIVQLRKEREELERKIKKHKSNKTNLTKDYEKIDSMYDSATDDSLYRLFEKRYSGK